ncbi:MAG: V-type ATP synthase subunit A, partial [Bacilli bacterium]
MNKNTIYSINGPVVKVKDSKDFSMLEMAYVGTAQLIGEVIGVNEQFTTIQVYESTTGLQVGEEVTPTGEAISVVLGPGLLSNIFDGIERPLKTLFDQHGAFIPNGSHLAPLDEARRWHITPKVVVGDQVIGGQIYASCPETTLIEHRLMIPLYLKGVVMSIAPVGDYTIHDVILTLKDEAGELHELTSLQKWPIKTPRPVTQRLPISIPLISGQRV